jgi:hypothetical protein
MRALNFLKDEKFSILFSFILGIGVICILRPMCEGNNCNVTKPPTEKDFDKYVYRMGGGKCVEFKSEIVDCPASGTIEAFRECSTIYHAPNELMGGQFSRRNSPIKRCE